MSINPEALGEQEFVAPPQSLTPESQEALAVTEEFAEQFHDVAALNEIATDNYELQETNTTKNSVEEAMSPPQEEYETEKTACSDHVIETSAEEAQAALAEESIQVNSADTPVPSTDTAHTEASLEEPTPVLKEAAPASSEESTPVLEEAAPASSEESTPVLEEAAPASFEEPTPVLEEAVPASSEEPTPVLEVVAPASSEEPTPVLEEAVLASSEEPIPVLEEAAPASSEEPTPVFEEAALASSKELTAAFEVINFQEANSTNESSQIEDATLIEDPLKELVLKQESAVEPNKESLFKDSDIPAAEECSPTLNESADQVLEEALSTKESNLNSGSSISEESKNTESPDSNVSEQAAESVLQDKIVAVV